MTCTVLVQSDKCKSSRKILAAHIWFRDGGVHHEGAEYDHLKLFRKRLNGAMTIESNPKYLDAVLELLGLEGAKDVLTPSVLAHSLQAMCWWSTLRHAGQSRRTVRGVDSGVDAWEANSRLDDCSETRDSFLEGHESFLSTSSGWTMRLTNMW